MFYTFSIKGLKKTACATLIIAVIILICRFIIIPKVLFPQKYSEYVIKYSDKYELEDALVFAVIKTESNFDPNARSHKDAMGLMQIRAITGNWGAEEIGLYNFSENDLFDPETNIQLGCWYLKKLLNQYDNNLETAVAAYNAGSGNVSKWLKDEKHSSDGYNINNIPFEQTRNYVLKIQVAKKVYEMIY